jgi:hypothetical protein
VWVSSDVDYSSCGWNHPRKGSANFDAAIGAHGDAGSTRHFDGAAFLSFDGDAINLLGNVLDQFGHVFVVVFGVDDVGVRHSSEGDYSSPRSISNRHHLGVFIAQVIARLQHMAVIGRGQHFAILQHSDSRTHLDGVAFQHFDLVNNGFFGETH